MKRLVSYYAVGWLTTPHTNSLVFLPDILARILDVVFC